MFTESISAVNQSSERLLSSPIIAKFPELRREARRWQPFFVQQPDLPLGALPYSPHIASKYATPTIGMEAVNALLEQLRQ